jgi:sterol desaturase/sphingolipid hydroxylase (fatty acid hydroxylase superfamily)
MIFLKFLVLFLYSNLLEYAIHRWAEHGPMWESNHKHHHDDPETPTLFLHSAKGVAGLAGLIGLSGLLFSFWGWMPTLFFFLYYVLMIEAAHLIAHRFHISKHHMTHHADLQDGNYNVWVPLGDILCGTRIKK